MKQRGFALVAAMLLPAAGVNHQPAFTLSAPPNELFATAVQGAGDADGDGRGDLLVYSFAMAGQHFVRLFSGLDGSLIHRFGPVMNGPTFYPGPPCAGVGDVDGDGFDDVIVGDSGSNRALVFSGLDASLIYELRPELLQPYDRFGGAVAGAGDVDGDGVGDLVVGCTGYRVGYVNVYSGADGALLFSLTHSEPGVEFGAAVAGAGDVDGDGRADVVVGAPGDGRYIVVPGLPPFVPPFKRVDQSGAVRVYSGLDGALLFTAFGDHEYDGLGFSVSSAGDVDGDGRADLIVGAPLETPLPAARVYSGRTRTTPAACSAPELGEVRPRQDRRIRIARRGRGPRWGGPVPGRAAT